MATLKKRTRLASVATATLTGASIFAIAAPGPTDNRETRRAAKRRPEPINEVDFDDTEYLDAS